MYGGVSQICGSRRRLGKVRIEKLLKDKRLGVFLGCDSGDFGRLKTHNASLVLPFWGVFLGFGRLFIFLREGAEDKYLIQGCHGPVGNTLKAKTQTVDQRRKGETEGGKRKKVKERGRKGEGKGKARAGRLQDFGAVILSSGGRDWIFGASSLGG